MSNQPNEVHNGVDCPGCELALSMSDPRHKRSNNRIGFDVRDGKKGTLVNVPKRIWLQTGFAVMDAVDGSEINFQDLDEVTWCQDDIEHGDVEYVRADIAARSQVDAADWRDGAAAPRDGTAFRAYNPTLVHPDFNPWGTVETVFDGEKFIGAAWDGVFDCWNTVEVIPELWQPLTGPKSPASAPADEVERAGIGRAVEVVERKRDELQAERDRTFRARIFDIADQREAQVRVCNEILAELKGEG